MKTISEEEWKKIIFNSDSVKMKFHELFTLTCKKCGSNDVEIFGEYDQSGVYYAGETGDFIGVVKCHKCGNAKVFKSYGYPSRENLDEWSE